MALGKEGDFCCSSQKSNGVKHCLLCLKQRLNFVFVGVTEKILFLFTYLTIKNVAK